LLTIKIAETTMLVMGHPIEEKTNHIMTVDLMIKQVLTITKNIVKFKKESLRNKRMITTKIRTNKLS